jgi:hypothetical protein
MWETAAECDCVGECVREGEGERGGEGGEGEKEEKEPRGAF